MPDLAFASFAGLLVAVAMVASVILYPVVASSVLILAVGIVAYAATLI